uniref:Uncharacterized protein n=1 Tax=Glossina brevipalpis TaxID=37001 RepID=A0A1A9WSC0_9MUSC
MRLAFPATALSCSVYGHNSAATVSHTTFCGCEFSNIARHSTAQHSTAQQSTVFHISHKTASPTQPPPPPPPSPLPSLSLVSVGFLIFFLCLHKNQYVGALEYFSK